MRPGPSQRALERPSLVARGLFLSALFLALLSTATCSRENGAGAIGDTGENDPGVPLSNEEVNLRTREDIAETDRRFAEALTTHRDTRHLDDLDAIKKRGVLRVITRNNSTSYFLYRGTEFGFHFELAKLLADDLGVRLEMVVPRANRDVIPWLLEGRGDIAIAGTANDAPRIDRVNVTRPYLKSSLVVVAPKARQAELSTLEGLAKVTLLVPPSSSATARLRQVAQAKNVSLDLKASLESLEAEDLLDRVGTGKADAAVVSKRIADVELLHRDDLAIAFEIPGEPLESGFLVRKENPRLFTAADDFLKRTYRGTVFNILYKRYHDDTRRSQNAREDGFRGDKLGALTPWDEIFREAAHDAGIDWRLLASQAVQESRLDPNARSQFGALGVMQLMPATAAELGVDDPLDPAKSIRGGARFMKKLVERYNDPKIELKDRVRFALAAYNVGPMHVRDARALAAREGFDPNRWFNHVENALLLLSKPRYYQKAEYGYCRGEEPVRYVSQIQSRYDQYVALTDPPPAQDTRP
jgi:membrane-bound lytic murein transglycosylase F